jgi:hypothetical protein
MAASRSARPTMLVTDSVDAGCTLQIAAMKTDGQIRRTIRSATA